MILTQNITVRINKSNIEHFNKFYPNIKIGDIITIKVEELSKYSHRKILIKCDLCDNKKYTTSKNYNKYIKNGKYTCCKCNSEKRKNTCIKKYGVSNIANSELTKEKMKSKILKKFGVDYYFQSNEFKSKVRVNLIKKGFNVSSTNREDWTGYQRICLTESYKNYKKLKKEWDGYDYYDKTYIKSNYNLNPNDSNYPTIDHKISIIHGYLNNIKPEVISSIENLCITKRHINSAKRHLTENEFKSLNFINRAVPITRK